MRDFWRRRSRQPAAQYLSVLDIGTTAVRALVIERVSPGQAAILGYARVAAHGRLAACEEALCAAEDATEEAIGHKIVPDVTLMAMPTHLVRGAWGRGGVRRAALETAITADECAAPLARAGRHALRNLGRVVGPGEWELIDATVVAFEVNGNRVTDPVGFRGYSLEATVAVFAAPRVTMRELAAIADALQLEAFIPVAVPVALAAAAPGDGLIVEIGARSTGMVLARCGAPLATGSVSLGTRWWCDTLRDFFAPVQLEAVWQALSDGTLSAQDKAAIRDALNAPLHDWQRRVLARLGEWKGSALLSRLVDGNTGWPPDIYLCGGGSLIPNVESMMATARWLQELPFPREPEVRVWNGATAGVVSRLPDRTIPLWRADNAVVVSLAAWAARERGPTTPDGMLLASLEL